MNIPVWKSTYWLVRRELWEHRGGFLWAPILTSAIFLALNLLAIVTGEVRGDLNVNLHNSRHDISINVNDNSTISINGMLANLDAGQLRMVGAGLDLAMYVSTFIICIVLGFVVMFYCLGALYNERSDRSILFWKSLPLSDTATVLSKVISATVLAPLITFAVGALTGIAMLLIYTAVLALHGVNMLSMLSLAHPLQVLVNLLGAIPLYLLWSLPAVGWLMLCSAWSRSKPFLWALVLPLATGVILSWFGLMQSTLGISTRWYWKHIFGRVLISVFPGTWLGDDSLVSVATHDIGSFLESLNIQHTYTLLGSPNLWTGAAAGAVMLAGAVWLRRWRDDS